MAISGAAGSSLFYVLCVYVSILLLIYSLYSLAVDRFARSGVMDRRFTRCSVAVVESNLIFRMC